MAHGFTRGMLAIICIGGGIIGFSACETSRAVEPVAHGSGTPLADQYVIPITNKRQIVWTLGWRGGDVKASGAPIILIECTEGPLSVFTPGGTHPTNPQIPDIDGEFAPVAEAARQAIGPSRTIPEGGVRIPAGETWRVKAQGMKHDSFAGVSAAIEIWDDDWDSWKPLMGYNGHWLIQWEAFSWHPKGEKCHDQGGN